jgi:uncharacterized protein YjiS (DUF1127 family)
MVMIGPERARGWRRVKKTFATWRHDAHLHRDLMMLSDRCLEDIGISRRWTADVRPTKPFWLP